jgi:probable rRNA maturation factor
LKSISFFYEEIDYRLFNEKLIVKWLISVAELHKAQISSINYILSSDSYLHKINLDFLSHDTYTDIITFPYSEAITGIESDIYLSIDRVLENSTNLNQTFEDELHRVLLHGLLHLLGHDDKIDTQKVEMRKSEDYYLSLWPSSLISIKSDL